MQSATVPDLLVKQGEALYQTYRWATKSPEGVVTPYDLSGWSGMANFALDLDSDPFYQASTADGTMSLTADGLIILDIPDEDTVFFPGENRLGPARVGVFEVFLIEPPDEGHLVFQGRLAVQRRIA